MEKAIVEELNKELDKIPWLYSQPVFAAISYPGLLSVLQGEGCSSKIKAVEYLFYRFELMVPSDWEHSKFSLKVWRSFKKECGIPFKIMSMRGFSGEILWVLSEKHAKYIIASLNTIKKTRIFYPINDAGCDII